MSEDGKEPIVVPKKYGSGWTLNFARPGSWVVVLVLIVVGLLIGYVVHRLH